jgi:ferrous iron transport protein A
MQLHCRRTKLAMTLDQLESGQPATITAIEGDGPLIQRLMALGLLEGSPVAVIRRAIGGDPIEVEVMGYALSLRRAEASRIQVTLNDD